MGDLSQLTDEELLKQLTYANQVVETLLAQVLSACSSLIELDQLVGPLLDTAIGRGLVPATLDEPGGTDTTE